MRTLIVVDDMTDWPATIEGAEVISSRDYLTHPTISEERGIRVVNLCRTYRYQSTGYYVSHLATARGHQPFPNLSTVLDMKARSVVRIVEEDLDALVKRSLAELSDDRLDLRIYFGRTQEADYQPLGRRLLSHFPAPLLLARFARKRDGWHIASIAPIAARDVPPDDRPFIMDSARAYLVGDRNVARRKRAFHWDLAVLLNPDEVEPPSQTKAIDRFEKACASQGIRVDRITAADAGRVSAYDALFIRETTSVNHYTFRIAQRAEAEQLAVIDDPTSILRCSNKVFLAEAMVRKGIPTPKTIIGHRQNLHEISAVTGLPCVLKSPDGSFSRGVTKAKTEEELVEKANVILETSDLFVAQEFYPTDFDWRIGVLDRQPLFACRYHMAKGHWQIVNRAGGRERWGSSDNVPLAHVPRFVVQTALKASAAMGDGLYGVDIKQQGKRCVVVEVNDNPNMDAGLEDRELGMELWNRLARSFLSRIEALRGGQNR